MTTATSLIVKIFFVCLTLVSGIWLYTHMSGIDGAPRPVTLVSALSIIGLYITSHLFRMMRLSILSLERRSQILPIALVHAATAFPSSLIPFKGGEILRLAGFIIVSKKTETALSLWLTERFFDVVTICSLIGILYFVDTSIPKALQYILVLFFIVSIMGILAFFSVTKLFTFLNRYLVLQSTSRRALRLLIISHQIQIIEKEIIKSITGRVASLILTSISIWVLELFAIFTFLTNGNIQSQQISLYFTQALAGILPGYTLELHAFYPILQSISLIVLATTSMILLCLATTTVWNKNDSIK